jgi:hypothetical protein
MAQSAEARRIEQLPTCPMQLTIVMSTSNSGTVKKAHDWPPKVILRQSIKSRQLQRKRESNAGSSDSMAFCLLAEMKIENCWSKSWRQRAARGWQTSRWCLVAHFPHLRQDLACDFRDKAKFTHGNIWQGCEPQYTQTHAEKIESGPPARIPTSEGPVVTAESVVVATNTPFNDFVTIHTKQAPYLSYAMAFGVPRGTVAKALYWDTLDPYHYVRLQSISEEQSKRDSLGDPHVEELLIVGGEDHKTGQADNAEERYRRLEQHVANGQVKSLRR